MKPFPTVLLLGALAGAPAARGNVWVVDDDVDQEPDFTTIGAAVLFAENGDTILVADGTYPSFTIDGKSLTVVADADASVTIREAVPVGGTIPPETVVSVQNLADDQAVVLKGLVVAPDPSTGQLLAALRVIDDAGDVWIEDVESTGNVFLFGPLAVGSSEAIEIRGSASVGLARSVFRSSSLDAIFALGTDRAATAAGLSVAAYDCQFVGAAGVGGPSSLPTCSASTVAAGDAFVLEDGTLFASGCTFTGGPGGDGDPPSTTFLGAGAGGDGGDGLRVESPLAVVTTRDCAFVAGPGGAGGVQNDGTPCASGAGGVAITTLAPITPLAGPARPFEVTSPLRVGETGAISYAGTPGDQALVVVAPTQGRPRSGASARCSSVRSCAPSRSGPWVPAARSTPRSSSRRRGRTTSARSSCRASC